MKELIEKLEKKIKNHREISKTRGEDFDLYLMANLEILKEIQKQESKPFDPVECGFKKEFDSDRESVFYKTMNNRIIFDKTKDLYLIDVYKFNIYSEIKNIRIPNHRQGVELLRNLGVIDAD